jgi:hypothetical protein
VRATRIGGAVSVLLLIGAMRGTQLAESLDCGSVELAMRVVPIEWWTAHLPARPRFARRGRTVRVRRLGAAPGQSR